MFSIVLFSPGSHNSLVKTCIFKKGLHLKLAYFSTYRRSFIGRSDYTGLQILEWAKLTKNQASYYRAHCWPHDREKAH